VGYQDTIVIKVWCDFYTASALLARIAKILKPCQGLWKLLTLASPSVTILIRKRIYIAATGTEFYSLL